MLTALLALSGLAAAQTTPAPAAPAPATALDTFLNQTGTLTVRESLGRFTLPGLYGSTIEVEAVRLYTPGQEERALKGIRLGANDGEKYSTARFVFVEASELDGMLAALDYMATQAPKLNAAVRPEVRFASKSNANIGVFMDTSQKVTGFVTVSSETAFMDTALLATLRQRLIELKTTLN